MQVNNLDDLQELLEQSREGQGPEEGTDSMGNINSEIAIDAFVEIVLDVAGRSPEKIKEWATVTGEMLMGAQEEAQALLNAYAQVSAGRDIYKAREQGLGAELRDIAGHYSKLLYILRAHETGKVCTRCYGPVEKGYMACLRCQLTDQVEKAGAQIEVSTANLVLMQERVDQLERQLLANNIQPADAPAIEVGMLKVSEDGAERKGKRARSNGSSNLH